FDQSTSRVRSRLVIRGGVRAGQRQASRSNAWLHVPTATVCRYRHGLHGLPPVSGCTDWSCRCRTARQSRQQHTTTCQLRCSCDSKNGHQMNSRSSMFCRKLLVTAVLTELAGQAVAQSVPTSSDNNEAQTGDNDTRRTGTSDSNTQQLEG